MEQSTVAAAGTHSGPAPGHAALANAIRALAMDAVEAAASGHPGMPMGMADAATVLAHEFLKFDSAAPDWPDRDRLVLSAGHGSMLLYALLHLTGYPGMGIDELQRFRKLGSRAAGHPEYGLAPGIETTTGPLGQGLANAVGMALAERLAAARWGDALVDHRVWALAGDGCLMEGVSHEAISLAGHLRLRKLTVLFDDNRVTIDGATDLSVSDNQQARFTAAGWHVEACDGHDPASVRAALERAVAADRPALVACRTTIGFGAPTKQGKAASHGAPLGADEVAGARAALGWPHPPFEIPAAVAAAWRAAGARGRAAREAWEERLAAAPERAAFEAALDGAVPDALDGEIAALKRAFARDTKPLATRRASQLTLEAVNRAMPATIGGSADLTGSNNTKTAELAPVARGAFAGRYVHYGAREQAMAACMNGIALHGGFVPYGGTFLVFSDYARPAMRLSALMGLRVIYVMSHDSIGLGEDGPTHQPVEHLAALRAVPNLAVFRPADAAETAECWQLALERREGPSVIVLTRQGVPPLRAEPGDGNRCAEGAYEVRAAPESADNEDEAPATLLATGSEVSVAVAAAERLAEEGIAARVVSMPCWELLEARPAERREALLGHGPRVAVEAAAPLGWGRWGVDEREMVAMRGFGASAPAAALFAHFGITAGAAAEAVKSALGKPAS